jgi:tripartite-type tricarboxylate transporter receptor subunit TctC
MRNWLLGAGALAMGLWAGSALAQTYPGRPITVVVPFAAGGPADTAAKLVTEAMAKDLGQPIVIENMGGAGGSLGAGHVAEAEPDGYTLLFHNVGLATSEALYPDLPYDTVNAFEYVGLVTDGPMTIVARRDLEAADLKGLVDLARTTEGGLTIGNAGVGSASYLCDMLLMSVTGIPLVPVPYKGTGPAMTDLVDGRIDVMCDQTTNTTRQILAGTIKAYAVTTASRLDVLPDVPTTDEAGIDGLRISIWHGLFAPKGTPAGITERLSLALQAALEDPNVVARLAELGTDPAPEADATPERLKAKLESEIARWKPVIEAAGAYVD